MGPAASGIGAEVYDADGGNVGPALALAPPSAVCLREAYDGGTYLIWRDLLSGFPSENALPQYEQSGCGGAAYAAGSGIPLGFAVASHFVATETFVVTSYVGSATFLSGETWDGGCSDYGAPNAQSDVYALTRVGSVSPHRVPLRLVLP